MKKRTNVMTTAKHQDELIGEGFKATFEYETLDGVVIKTVTANVSKNGKTFYVSKSADGNGQSINGDYGDDFEVVNLIVNELKAIIAENSEPVKKG